MMCPEFNMDLTGMALDEERQRRIAETLGDRPRHALSALVGYGLNDADIARYHRLPDQVVTELRDFWGIVPNG